MEIRCRWDSWHLISFYTARTTRTTKLRINRYFDGWNCTKKVRSTRYKNNKIHCSRSTSREREDKAKRLQQLDKCKIDQNDTTERWKDVQHIQRRKRIPREQIPTEIHREHTESIREDGMDITNDTWPFSLHQPPPHCTTRRIVVSSSLFHSLFLLVPSHPSFKPNLFPSSL